MTLLTSVPRLQPIQNTPSTFEWHRELEQLSFSWRESTALPEITPADTEASVMIEKSHQDTIQSFVDLLSRGESKEAGYASIYARIATSLSKDSIVRDALNDALTVAVAVVFLHDDAKQTVEKFNDRVMVEFIEPIQESGQGLVQALERCAELSLTEFDTQVMKPLVGFFTEVQNNVETIAKYAQRESMSFIREAAKTAERTAAFVVTSISDAAFSMIDDSVQATTKRVSAHLNASAHEHQGFLRETAQMIEELVFRGDEAFKVA